MGFLNTLPPPGPARQAVILGAIASGHLDPPTWHEVPFAGGTITVSGRYLTIAGETCPMTADVAQAAVDSLSASLPTVAVVDAIERAPGCLIVPLRTQRPDGGEQGSVAFARCQAATAAMFEARKVAPGALVAGYRKDIVTPAPDGHVAIYGAHWPLGGRLQPYSAAHGLFWSEYAMAVRAVRGLPDPWRYPLPW